MAKIHINNPKQVINGGAKKYYFKVKGLGGPKGDKGDKGDTGATGPEGPQGNAATVSIGSTTTLPVGYDATVTNSGSIYNAVLNFGIPQGPRGPQGATGATGAKGDKGDQGNPGPQGEKGTNATVYIGTTTTGEPGTQASVYNSGTSSNAVLNFTIPRGDVGPSVPLVQETGYSTTEAMSQNATTEALNGKQNTLTAGSNITISGNTISATDTTYTAGNNVQINGTTISATDTTYTAGNGLNLNGTEFSADTTVLATKEDLESYYTKPETDNLLAPKLEAEVVAELPTTGAEGKLYLTPKAHTTSTATGNPITATVAEDVGVIESFQLDGDTFQQSYEGKNLLMNKEVAQEKTGITITPNSDGSFTLDGTATATTDFYFAGAWSNRTISYLDMPSGDYTLSLLDSAKQQVTSPKFRIELYDRMGENSSRILWLQQSGSSPLTVTIANPSQVTAYYISIPINQSFTNEKFYIQLEKGTTATDFEKFVGGQPSPNPDYPQQIQTVTGEQTVTVTGKNKINMPYREFEWDGARVLQNGTTLTMKPSSTGGMAMSYSSSVIDIAIPAGETITWSRTWLGGGTWGSGAFTFPLEITYSDGTTETISLGDTSKNNYLVAASRSVTLAKDVVSVRLLRALCYGIKEMTGDIVFGVQLEYGSTPTSYAPYSKQTLPISLGSIELCKLGDYQDYIYKDGDDWKVHKTVGKKLLGEFDYSYYSNTIYYIANASTALGINTSTDTQLYSECFTGSRDSSVTNRMFYGSANNRFNIYPDAAFMTTYNTVDKFKKWLNDNSISLYCIVATPTDTTITDTNLIAQLEAILTATLQNGANTITNTATGSNLAGDMEIGYYGYNPTNRYDKWLWLDINNNYEQIGS